MWHGVTQSFVKAASPKVLQNITKYVAVALGF